MGMRGRQNARGSQFLRGVAYVRHYGSEGIAGGKVIFRPNNDYIVGFTSGIPSTAADAGSGISIPAEGVYRAVAVVNISGTSPIPAVVTAAGPMYGIKLTLDNSNILQSQRNIVAVSGLTGASRPDVTFLETEATFYARKNDTLRVVVRSNADAGGFTLMGVEETSGADMPWSHPAAFVHLQRIPTKELGSDTYLV